MTITLKVLLCHYPTTTTLQLPRLWNKKLRLGFAKTDSPSNPGKIGHWFLSFDVPPACERGSTRTAP